jgi:flavodoxin
MNMQVKAFTLAMITMLISYSDAEARMSSTNNKILVTYFSHSGNTREIALQIKEATGADLFEIVPVNPYPTNYDAVVEQAKQELKVDYRPELKSAVSNIASYDVIFVGSPNWWGTITPPVMTFLSTHDFSGKTIVPFITHEGSGLGRSERDVKRSAPGATVLEGQSFRGRDVKYARNDVLKWLREIKLLK